MHFQLIINHYKTHTIEPITTTTTRSASTTLSSTTSSDTTISQLSPNETQPVSVPDETTVNPELNTTYDATTLSSTETDNDENIRGNETTTTTPFTTTSMNLEGIDYKQSKAEYYSCC